MSFIVRWLGLERPGARVGLRPHRDLELELDYDAAYARCMDAVERVLGATVAIDDRSGGLIEAAFGLVNSERVRCTFSRVDSNRTALRIEAFFPAGTAVPETSRNVDALAAALSLPAA
jgi:hypothetical protein